MEHDPRASMTDWLQRFWGMQYVLDVRPDMTVWPLEPVWSKRAYQGFGRPRQPRLRSGQRLTMAERSLALPKESWREITVAEGSPGPEARRNPLGQSTARIWTAASPATTCPTPRRHPVGDPGPRGRVAVAH